jgi:hypothetical protein
MITFMWNQILIQCINMIIARPDNLGEHPAHKPPDFNRSLRSAILLIMWSLNYCLLVFIAVLGVLQLAAAYNNFRGLLFFPRTIFTVCFAVLAIGIALFAFFTWNDLHKIIVNGSQKIFIVEGSQQTGLFVLSAAAGILFTLVFSSVVNYRRFSAGDSEQDGLDALRESTFFQAIRNHRGGKE